MIPTFFYNNSQKSSFLEGSRSDVRLGERFGWAWRVLWAAVSRSTTGVTAARPP